jgi:hypothetical protein
MKGITPNLRHLANKKSNEKGQSLIEFVFLMASMILISFLLLKGFNSGIGTIWTTYVKAIAKPTTSPIQLR